jgi:hypothetical protein
MSTPEELSNDSLGDLLRMNSGAESPDDALREAVYRQTIGALRFRRRMKKCAMVASLVVCYFAGIATMGFRSTPIAVLETSAGQSAINQSPLPHDNPQKPAIADVKHKPQSVAPPMSRDEKLRREADELLADGDLKQAIHKYELALDLAPADQRAISPQHDTWLLMALKNARPKEITHDYAQP